MQEILKKIKEYNAKNGNFSPSAENIETIA